MAQPHPRPHGDTKEKIEFGEQQIMNIENTIDALWSSHQAGIHYPEEWMKQLSVDDAYRVQLGILSKKSAAGALHSGWKVGLTADVVREVYSASDPVFGYLLEEGSFRSGHTFRFADLHPPLMETEILITLKDAVSGRNPSRRDALNAIGTIAPAFEVPERRGGGLELDFSLGIVDNVSQRAYVWGEEIELPDDFEFGDINLELMKNGQRSTSVRGCDVMDHQLDTLVWLAKVLSRHGVELSAGQRIMSGSFTKPAPVENGDQYTARFSGVGEVSMSFE